MRQKLSRYFTDCLKLKRAVQTTFETHKGM